MQEIIQIPIKETTSYFDFLKEVQMLFYELNSSPGNCNKLDKTERIMRIINSDYKKVLIVKFENMQLDCDSKVMDWLSYELEHWQ